MIFNLRVQLRMIIFSVDGGLPMEYGRGSDEYSEGWREGVGKNGPKRF